MYRSMFFAVLARCLHHPEPSFRASGSFTDQRFSAREIGTQRLAWLTICNVCLRELTGSRS